jgi:starch-binding outer membrane protein, SusD/RagB family
MKNILIIFNSIIISMVLMFMIGFASCSKDYLNVEPKDQISDATLWSSSANADLFLQNIYSAMPDLLGWWHQGTSAEDGTENYSDNSMNGVEWRYSRSIYAKSVYTPSNALSHWFWYNSIRDANLFIEKVSESSLDTAWKPHALAEARFLRALYYQELWKQYGGVPIITEVQDRQADGDAIFVARNTSDEVFEFITDELAAITADLLINPQSGRASRGAALALKGWCELYQASPLNNPTNDVNRWAKAAATFNQLMGLGVYDLFPDYANLFMEENNGNVETIFAKKHIGGTGLGGIFIIEANVPYHKESWAGDGGYCPTQELVDDYLMANGLPISDPLSGYNDQDPYLNREKRFYQTVIYNGSMWRGDTIKTWVGSGSRNTLDFAGASEAGQTSYYLRKGLDEKWAQDWVRTSSQDWIIFRYAEILLSYAEAQNEASGPDASVYDAVNKVRSRSLLPDLKSGLNKDQTRLAIMRERRVELAFEEKRWFDLRRWKLAEDKLNGSLHAMSITRANGQYVYTIIPAPGGDREFYPRNYLLPIPQSAIDRNPSLEQNPGY